MSSMFFRSLGENPSVEPSEAAPKLPVSNMLTSKARSASSEAAAATAEEVAKLFVECIAAPAFDEKAKAIFAAKKNLRLLELPFAGLEPDRELQLKRISGGRPVLTVKRSASASPATGSAKAHDMEQKTLIEIAFGGAK